MQRTTEGAFRESTPLRVGVKIDLVRGRRWTIGVAGCAMIACANDRAPAPAPASASASASAPATAVASAPAPAPTPAPAAAPAIDTLPWELGDGNGVARKDTRIDGDNVFVAYAGWRVSLASAEAWASALWEKSLKARGVRWIWAVQGPAEPMYVHHEIGNALLASALARTVTSETKFVLVVAHSSGAYVANELFAKLAHGADPNDATRERIVYFNLDGGDAGLDGAIVDRLKRAYFVGAFDAAIATASHEDGDMKAAGATYAGAGGYFRHDARGSGCKKGATWCVHMTLVTNKPHDPGDAKEIDFADFAGREVTHAYLDAKAGEAGLDP
jgi:hypothetical protein